MTSIGGVSLSLGLDTSRIKSQVNNVISLLSGVDNINIGRGLSSGLNFAVRSARDLSYEMRGVGQNVDGIALANLIDETIKFKKAWSEVAGEVSKFKDLVEQTSQISGTSLSKTFDVGEGVKNFVSLEKSLLQFESLNLDASSKSISGVKDQVKLLGIETSKAPTDIAQTAVGMSQLGFSADQVTDSLRGVVKLSEASSEGLQEVSVVVGAALNQFGLAASESAKVGDILYSGASASASNVLTLGEGLRYVGATAKNANQSLEDTVIALALLSKGGLDSTTGGTNYAAAIRNLQIAAANAKPSLKDLGTEVKLTKEELLELANTTPETPSIGRAGATKAKALGVLGLSREELLNEAGGLKSVLEIVPLLSAKIKELSQTSEGAAQVPVLLNAIFGVQGGNAMLTLLGQVDTELATVTEKVRNHAGSTEAASKKMLEGLSGSLQLLGGTIQTASVIVGGTWAPILEVVTRGATSLINSFIGLPAPLQSALILFGSLSPVLLLYYRSLKLVEIAKLALTKVSGLWTLAQSKEGVATIQSMVATNLKNVSLKASSVMQALTARATLVTTGAYTQQAIVADILKVKTIAGTAAQQFFNNSIVAGLKTLKVMATQLGLVAGAFLLFSAVSYKTAGAKTGDDFIKAAKDIEKFRGEIDRAKTATEGFGGAMGRIGDVWASSGWVEGSRQAFYELAKAIGLASDAVSDYGDNGKFLAAGQMSAQASMLRLSDALDIINKGYQQGIDLLMSSKKGTEEWKQQASERISSINNELKALTERRNAEGLTSNQKALVEATITNLERQKAQLQGVVSGQNAVAVATDASGKVQVASLKSVDAALDSNVAKIANTTQIAINAVRAEQESRVLTVQEAETRIAEIERQGRENRIAAIQAAIANLDKASLGASPEDMAAIEARKQELLKESLGIQNEIYTQAAKDRDNAEKSNLEAIKNAADEATTVIEQSQSQRIVAVKQAIADNVLTEEQGQLRIAEITEQGIQQRIQATNSELSALEAAYANREISEKDYGKTKRELIGQLSKLALEAADAEIAAQEKVKQAAIAAMELRLAKQQQLNDSINASAQEQVDSLKEVEDTMTSQLDLMQAQERLNKVIAQGEIARATDKGAATEKEMKRSQAASQKILRAQHEQQRQAANIAIAEARVTLQKAEQAKVQAQITLQIARQSGEVHKIIQAEMALAQAIRERVAAGKGVEKAENSKVNLEKKQSIEEKIQKAEQRNERDSQSKDAASDARSAAVEKLTKAYEKQNQVLEYRNQQSSSYIETLRLETEGIKSQLEALDQRSELLKAQTDNQIANKEYLLSTLGGDSNSETRKAIEIQIANIRKKAAEEQIALDKEKLALKQEERKINAEIAAQEAIINRIKAEQNILQANYNLEKAKTEQNQQGIINARAEIDIATRGLEIASKREAMAQKAQQQTNKSIENENKINELVADTTKKQAATATATASMASSQKEAANAAERQSSALADSADSAKEAAQALQKAKDAANTSSFQSVIWDERELKKQELEAAAKLADLAGDTEKSKEIKAQIEREKKAFELEDLKAELTSIQQRREQNRSSVADQMHMIDEMTRLTGGAGIDGKTGRMITVDAGAMKREKMQELQNQFGIDPMGGGSGIEGLSQIISQAQMNVNQSPQMQEALAKSNRGVEERLDKLSGNMERIASSPRSVTINGSDNPSGDLPGVLQSLQRAKM